MRNLVAKDFEMENKFIANFVKKFATNDTLNCTTYLQILKLYFNFLKNIITDHWGINRLFFFFFFLSLGQIKALFDKLI